MVRKITTKKSPGTKAARANQPTRRAVHAKSKASRKSAPMANNKSMQFSWDIKTWNLAPLATLGPIGFFPKGSGTLGALVALPIVYVLSYLSISLLWCATFVLFLLGMIAVEQFTQDKTEKDPSCVIIDEVVGQMIPFMVILPEFMHWPVLLLGFALFRFFDIFKFGIVSFWDRRKNPLGVMMDDVTAGLCAGFIMAMLQVIVVEIFGI